jgi:hypothetical protein
MILWSLLLSAPPFLLALFLDWMRDPASPSAQSPSSEGRMLHATRSRGRRSTSASIPKLVAPRPIDRRERAPHRERLASGEKLKASLQPRSLDREARKS